MKVSQKKHQTPPVIPLKFKLFIKIMQHPKLNLQMHCAYIRMNRRDF